MLCYSVLLLSNSQGTTLGMIIMESNTLYPFSQLSTVIKSVPVIAVLLKLFPRMLCVRNITWWRRWDATYIIDTMILCRCLYCYQAPYGEEDYKRALFQHTLGQEGLIVYNGIQLEDDG